MLKGDFFEFWATHPFSYSLWSICFRLEASPCKFEESVTAAMGMEKWEEYRRVGFPSRAVDILSKEECEPTFYEWSDANMSLEDVQKLWEAKARELIVEHFL